jgi:Tfp pilus assembly protein PilZ
LDGKNAEKRECKRFVIPGASASITAKDYTEEFSPVLDISRGGVKLLVKRPVNMGTELTLKISVPAERIPLNLIGVVKWISYDDEKKKYGVGVQFNPYGVKKGQNYPGALVKIIALEQKFSIPGKGDDEKYEID